MAKKTNLMDELRKTTPSGQDKIEPTIRGDRKEESNTKQSSTSDSSTMAPKPKKVVKLSPKSEASLVQYVRQALLAKHAFSGFITKLSAIDRAYAAYKIKQTGNTDGLDVDQIIADTDVTITVAASQVDTVVASMAETFLSGYPLFPVVSGTKNKDIAEKFEAVVDYHAQKGKYVRQLAMGLKDAAKYDFVAIKTEWEDVSPFFPVGDSPFTILSKTKIPMNTVKRYDPYNTIWDYRVPPADVSAKGEYAGEIELISITRLKEYLNGISEAGTNLNIKKALHSKLAGLPKAMSSGLPNGASFDRSYNYTNHPQISDYINSTDFERGTNWVDWLANTSGSENAGSVYPPYSGMYEMVTLFARIIPAEHGMAVGRPNTPQIWKLVLINGMHLVYAQPISTPNNTLPVHIGQPLEDGLGYQTKSITERSIPFQNAASDMYNIKINSSKRAINDRMLYDPKYIDPMDINSPVPAAKIPVTLGMNMKMGDVAMQLPFNDSATSGAMNDLTHTLQMANMVNGLNPFRQGQAMKGNRTKAEFTGVYDSSELRTRLISLMTEVHIFMPLKDSIKLNILVHNKEIEAVDFRKGEIIDLNPVDLQNAVIEFKIADGYRPKDKLMSTEDLQIALTFLAQDSRIGGEYNIGDMFVHFMSMRGVKNLSQYKYDQDTKDSILAKAIPIMQAMQAQQSADGQPLTSEGQGGGPQ